MGGRLHEIGHGLNLRHAGDDPNYPYKGEMHGIQGPNKVYRRAHVGPNWAYDLRKKCFYIPPYST